VAGSIRHPDAGEAWEYTVVVTITNDRGEEINRQIVGVGALQPGEERTFNFAVEVFAPGGAAEATRSASATPVGSPITSSAPNPR
jgi:hypothetical protein